MGRPLGEAGVMGGRHVAVVLNNTYCRLAYVEIFMLLTLWRTISATRKRRATPLRVSTMSTDLVGVRTGFLVCAEQESPCWCMCIHVFS